MFFFKSGLYHDDIFFALVSGHSKDESKQTFYWVIFWHIDYSCLTWQPRRMASCTGPSVGMSAWQLWAPFEQSAGTDKQKKRNQYGREKPDMLKKACCCFYYAFVFEWFNKSVKVGWPCWCRRTWCTALHSVWCRSVTLSPHGPPGRYLREGWSLKRYPGG